ncbi:hypothetical protein BRARA_D00783 [Brassica rapa]|uniref:Replication protein A 70 kDa DNA-binding subunit B/D first OB fold domain-containing protein n=1 Tax=Brassica campestris TaxID=3711 RepID=A0A397ZIZ2_BRACM|nr:hypothetical protein BRARA_D00783 [Brassica rapa]
MAITTQIATFLATKHFIRWIDSSVVLTDEHGERIHAMCKRNQMKSVQRKLPLGKWHFLTLFSLSQASGQYRPTSHPYKMTIDDETVITNSDLIQDSIFLSLASFEDIINGSLKPHFLIDVMGKIVSLEPVKTMQVKLHDRKVVQFRLVDSSGKELACCLWRKYAEQLEVYVERLQPLVCLIMFAKIGFYRGEVQITNAFDASIVYLDPTMEDAFQFMEKFKLHLIVRNDTETCNLMLLNTVANTIVGHDAVDLWDGTYDEIVGKYFCFGIFVGSDNVTNGAYTFKILEVWSGDKFLEKESQSEPISMMAHHLLPCPLEVLMLEGTSQNESEECKTPFPKRKEEDADLPYISSTSKKLCSAIKVEKKKEE